MSSGNRILVVVIGRPSDPHLAGAIADYERRAARYWPLQVRELSGNRTRGGRPDEVRQREWVQIEAALPGSRELWVCDQSGVSMTSERFAATIRSRRESGRPIALVVGGAFGLPDEGRRRADLLLALAPWTLPHEIARLVLAEQLYRAGTIARNEPYHK
ncbi:MAG: 23S rRNA (pseudouridine(1915)-N(3))-methyltransferase RlmH [Actinomycetota bacterium]|nr:23S rRNA (pseudouridine(1915)-N(3))-methyltransferase RlmH [Actinomycetota bacterium]